jgi:proteasome lid subunit RPN8/RPN11
MIQIEQDAWERMVTHAHSTYPDECCGAMLGSSENGTKTVKVAVELENAHEGEKRERYVVRPKDLLRAEREARSQGMDLIGIYHSHPDADAYFSPTDLKNSCPWYSFVVLSVKNGKFHHAASFLPNEDQTAEYREQLVHPS